MRYGSMGIQQRHDVTCRRQPNRAYCGVPSAHTGVSSASEHKSLASTASEHYAEAVCRCESMRSLHIPAHLHAVTQAARDFEICRAELEMVRHKANASEQDVCALRDELKRVLARQWSVRARDLEQPHGSRSVTPVSATRQLLLGSSSSSPCLAPGQQQVPHTSGQQHTARSSTGAASRDATERRAAAAPMGKHAGQALHVSADSTRAAAAAPVGQQAGRVLQLPPGGARACSAEDEHQPGLPHEISQLRLQLQEAATRHAALERVRVRHVVTQHVGAAVLL